MMYCTNVYVTQHYKKMREKIKRNGENRREKAKKMKNKVKRVRTYFLFQVDLHVLLLHSRINTSQLH